MLMSGLAPWTMLTNWHSIMSNFNKVVGGVLDIGLKPPLHLMLGFDGSLILPAIPKFHNPQDAGYFLQ